MNPISPTTLPMTTPAATADAPAAPPSTDTLASMRPSMDAAFAVGRPSDATGAATILATASGYLQGAGSTIARLDQGIAERTRRLEQLARVEPDAAAKLAEQLDLLQRLRDRIQLSVERVSDILAGRERSDLAAPGVSPAPGERGARRVRDLAEPSGLGDLEARRQLLAPNVTAVAAVAGPASIAATYSMGSSSG